MYKVKLGYDYVDMKFWKVEKCYVLRLFLLFYYLFRIKKIVLNLILNKNS